jgi:hypothetical protein
MTEERCLQKGDLIRMCTIAELNSDLFPNEIDWCYGVYLESRVQVHSYDGFVDNYEEYDRILYAGRIMECDHYWYIERIS